VLLELGCPMENGLATAVARSKLHVATFLADRLVTVKDLDFASSDALSTVIRNSKQMTFLSANIQGQLLDWTALGDALAANSSLESLEISDLSLGMNLQGLNVTTFSTESPVLSRNEPDGMTELAPALKHFLTCLQHNYTLQNLAIGS